MNQGPGRGAFTHSSPGQLTVDWALLQVLLHKSVYSVLTTALGCGASHPPHCTGEETEAPRG